MHSCPNCGTALTDEAAACPHCSDPSGPMNHCSRCGEDYSDSDSCPACGALNQPAACDDHADREAVGRCVICGRAVCEECQAAEARVCRCDQHQGVVLIEGWAQVYSTTSEFEAQLVRENLRAEGVEAQIYSQRDSVFSVDLGELSIVRLLVPVWEYGRALQVIRSHMDTEGEVVFACPACGEAYEPGARECTACSAPLV